MRHILILLVYSLVKGHGGNSVEVPQFIRVYWEYVADIIYIVKTDIILCEVNSKKYYECRLNGKKPLKCTISISPYILILC